MNRLIIHHSQESTSAALFEENRLAEFFVERSAGGPTMGSIYNGRVVNVLRGMQAAFVDIGEAKNGFLYIDDVLPANLEQWPDPKPSIDTLVKEGQTIAVQVIRGPIGNKGAKLSTHYSLPGRMIVYMPYAGYFGVSKKIDSEEERIRLRSLGEELQQNEEGYIFRTVADRMDDAAIASDLHRLRTLWQNIKKRESESKAPSLLYSDLNLVPRLMRDLITDHIDEIWVDHEPTLLEMSYYFAETAPHLIERILHYEEEEPILQRFNVKQPLLQLTRRKVWLECGGYLVIDHTEAMTVIDVNTGKYTGKIDLEQTVYDTNMQAAQTIARLLRLRDIGGIVIIDFIDMDEEKHRMEVMDKLSACLQTDRTRSTVIGWTQLGLLELTRKKVREHLDDQLFEICSACQGTGKIQTDNLEGFIK